jgi:hypothetical protein
MHRTWIAETTFRRSKCTYHSGRFAVEYSDLSAAPGSAVLPFLAVPHFPAVSFALHAEIEATKSPSPAATKTMASSRLYVTTSSLERANRSATKNVLIIVPEDDSER